MYKKELNINNIFTMVRYAWENFMPKYSPYTLARQHVAGKWKSSLFLLIKLDIDRVYCIRIFIW